MPDDELELDLADDEPDDLEACSVYGGACVVPSDLAEELRKALERNCGA
jgi:hypothetical protein